MRVYVTGGNGFLGSRVVALLRERGHGASFRYHSHLDPDFRDLEVLRTELRQSWKEKEGGGIGHVYPEAVIHCAGVVGGMLDNAKHPAKYLTDNLQMGLNVLEAAREIGCKVVMAGSSCMYPDPCYGPYGLGGLWSGKPYEGNLGYGIAKRVICEAATAYRKEHGLDAFTCVLPNLYGPGGDGSEKGHFVAGVVRKIKAAKESGAESVEMMGDGTAKRELIYVDDAAKALIFALENDLGPDPMNFGTNKEHTVREVVEIVKVLMGYEGRVVWGDARDNGQQRKIMDSSIANVRGWSAEVSLIEGLRRIVGGK